jgi:hypothetical protein
MEFEKFILPVILISYIFAIIIYANYKYSKNKK